MDGGVKIIEEYVLGLFDPLGEDIIACKLGV